jgi:hypothetical protein
MAIREDECSRAGELVPYPKVNVTYTKGRQNPPKNVSTFQTVFFPHFVRVIFANSLEMFLSWL